MYPAAEVPWGQSVSITCSASTLPQQLISKTSFILEKTSSSFRESRTPGSSSASFSLQEVNLDHEGPYRCQYQIRVSGRDFSSAFSDSVRLSVAVPKQKPNLSMMSSSGGALGGSDGPEVPWGQSVSITCSASTLPQQLVSKTSFILEKTSSSFRESRTPGSSSASFSLQEVNLDHEGPYRCQYQIRVSGRDFSSAFSDSVRLSVAVPLQQPTLFLASPSGGLFWSPEGAELTRGHSLLLTCSIAPQYPGGFFSLLFSGSSLNVSRPAVNRSASFSFPAVGSEQQGNYSCVYEVTLSSRTFTSTQEAPISLIVIFPVMVLVSSVCGGGLLLVLLVLGGVFFFLVRRRGPGDLNQTQMSVRAMNIYKREEEEEEENIYVNFDGGDTEKKQQSRRGEEEDISEQPESCASFREGNEEEGEPSDDEDDYVNATPGIVSGDHEDVYQNF
ncbi:immunoglobulin superfamily member 1-like [Eleginops maclovinus]